MISQNAALIAASALLIATFVLPRVISSWPLWLRALWRVTAFIGLTLLIQRTIGSPIAPRFQELESGGRFWEQAIEAGWWLLGAQGAIGLTRLFIVFEARPRETRIVSDLLAGVIYLVTLLAVVNFVFQVPIGGLLATSGVIAIVLGLALQSSLSDVFSGIAVGIERPYSPGDIVWVEGGIEGRVVQVNWRSTHIATFNQDVAVIPNSVMAKSRLVNHSLPTTIRGTSVTVRVDAREPSAHCIAVLTAAATTCMLLQDDPAPTVALTDLAGDGAAYEISYSVTSGAVMLAARTEILGQIQNHLRHAGISLAVAGKAIVPSTKAPSPAEMLEQSDWFGVLAPEDRALLTEHLTEILAGPGDSLIREDDDPQALFLIASGSVEISSSTTIDKRIIYRMGPGGSLGAIGLITGSPYAATATAKTHVRAYRIDKNAIGAAMRFRPELVNTLEALARRGRTLQHTDPVAPEGYRLEHSHLFLASLRSFLQRLSLQASP